MPTLEADRAARLAQLKRTYAELCRVMPPEDLPDPTADSVRVRYQELLVKAKLPIQGEHQAVQRLFSRRSGDSWFEPLMEDLSRSVSNAAKSIGFVSSENEPVFYVNTLPDGVLNACAVPTEAGYLLLLNFGLMVLAYKAAKLVAQSAALDGENAPEPPVMNAASAADHFYQITAAYFGLADRAPKLEPEGVRLRFASILTTSEEAFALAHEYMHMLVQADLFPKPADYEASTEVMADLLGAMVLMRMTEAEGFFNGQSPMTVMAGPFLLLACMDFLERANRALLNGTESPHGHTHPDADVRLEALTRWAERSGFPTELGHAVAWAIHDFGSSAMPRLLERARASTDMAH